MSAGRGLVSAALCSDGPVASVHGRCSCWSRCRCWFWSWRRGARLQTSPASLGWVPISLLGHLGVPLALPGTWVGAVSLLVRHPRTGYLRDG